MPYSIFTHGAYDQSMFALNRYEYGLVSKAIEDGHGDYALNITGPILKFFEKYYSVPYPLSKSGMFKPSF